jgi:hypothetical protein
MSDRSSLHFSYLFTGQPGNRKIIVINEMIAIISSQTFLYYGALICFPTQCEIIARNFNQAKTRDIRRYREMLQTSFGTTPEICSILWGLIAPNFSVEGACPRHLLWALILLRTYHKESDISSRIGVHVQTFRKFSFLFIEAIASLKDIVVR